MTEGEPFASPYFHQLDVEPVFVHVVVAFEAQCYEVVLVVPTASGSVIDMMQLQPVLAGCAAGLALTVITIEHRSTDRFRYVLRVFSGEVTISVDDASHYSLSLSSLVLCELERSRFPSSSSAAQRSPHTRHTKVPKRELVHSVSSESHVGQICSFTV